MLRTEAAVHVPDRIMRQSASRIAHECFRLNYQIPPALACRAGMVYRPGGSHWLRPSGLVDSSTVEGSAFLYRPTPNLPRMVSSLFRGAARIGDARL